MLLIKSVRVALTTLARMLTCVQTEGEGAGEIEYVLSVAYIIKRNFVAKNGYDLSFYPSVYYIYLFGQCLCGFWFLCCFRL